MQCKLRLASSWHSFSRVTALSRPDRISKTIIPDDSFQSLFFEQIILFMPLPRLTLTLWGNQYGNTCLPVKSLVSLIIGWYSCCWVKGH